MDLHDYKTEDYFDELIEVGVHPRMAAKPLINLFAQIGPDELRQRQAAAERAMFESGTTFNVYDDDRATERIIPFDVVPRVIDAGDWARVEKGLASASRRSISFSATSTAPGTSCRTV